MAVIDKNFGYEDTTRSYPYILFTDYITEIARVLVDLPDGNLPLCIYYEDSEKYLGKNIAKDLELLSRLADIQPYFIYTSKGKRKLITCAEDLIYLDEFDWSA